MTPKKGICGILSFFLMSVAVFASSLKQTPLEKRFDYKEVVKLSLLFYEAQRSGKLPIDNRIRWRGDSALGDVGQNGEDLSGGYFDASDYVKFSFTMAFTTTMLSWGFVSYEDSYKTANQYKEAIEAIKWATDYFLKCHTSRYEFYGQVGDFFADHKFWGRPEDLNMTRPAYKIDRDHPGSDLAGEAAAALASSSIIFRKLNVTYANILLKHAEELYDFAVTYRGLYHEAIIGAKNYYESSGYGDELCWASFWLHKATNTTEYLRKAKEHYQTFKLNERSNSFYYDKKTAGLQLLLAIETGDPQYINSTKVFCDYAIKKQLRTPKGLLFINKYGTLAHAANVAFICLQAANLTSSPAEYISFARQQINYMLGATGRSYVVGFGENYPKNPYHAASSCPNRPLSCGSEQLISDKPNEQILYGALVSGPDQNDYYIDTREEFLYNEVTIDNNAGFQGVLAGLIKYGFN